MIMSDKIWKNFVFTSQTYNALFMESKTKVT